jgi:predicted porin
MKKSLLALAVLGAFAGAASAQSSVTLYGLLDLSIAKSNGGTQPNAGAPAGKAYNMQQSAASRLGFRGSEDIGGGWSAQFQIEHRFTPDDGNTNVATPFWGARSYVQITNSAVGSVYMGRDYGPEFWPAVKTDPFGWDGVGQINGLQYAGYSTSLNGASSVRTSNTGGFKSRSFGGLTVQLAVSLGEGQTNGAGRVVGGNAEYAGGPIYAALGFSKTTDGLNDGNQLINFGAAYDLGFVRPAVYFAQSKTALGTITNKDIMVALTAPIGPGKLKLAYDRLDPNSNVSNNNQSKVGIGYDYPLSKRTNVYADFGQAKSDVAGVTTNKAAAVGMKHTF